MIARKLGHYELLEQIGSGGMGDVYRARDPRLGRDVAIKRIREDLALDPKHLERFTQEARAASTLHHPNIVHIYDVGLEHRTPFIVMELVEGSTLREELSHGPIRGARLLRIATQIAEGLASAHAAGLVHRDLKPENLILSREGYVKILDFGIAKLVEDRRAPESTSTGTPFRPLTTEGSILGTTSYMSPEQARGDSLDHRSDQFSLGSILYEMVTGKRAFARDTVPQTLAAILDEEPDPGPLTRAALPSRLHEILDRCLSKSKLDRYDSTRDLVLDLRSAGSEAQQPVPTPEPSTARPRSRRWILGAGLAAIIAALVVATMVLLRRNVSHPNPSIRSLAVLPLQNLSRDPDEEYFADGMTEALITELAKLGDLKVISRTSVMGYKNTEKHLPEIGKELGVDGVIEGSAMRVGDRVRITVQLVEAESDRHLWAQSYDRDAGDVLALQSDVALNISREIDLQVSGRKPGRLDRSVRINPRANDTYLKGLYLVNRAINSPDRSVSLYEESFARFREAISLEPDWALPYAALARAYHWMASEGHPGLYADSKRAAEKALSLDDSVAEAHGALAFVLYQYHWDWDGARAHYQRAIELNPSLAIDGHSGYALLLAGEGRFDEAVAQIQRAEELDPMTIPLKVNIGLIYMMNRRYQDAIQTLRGVIEVAPQEPSARVLLGQALILAGHVNEGLESIQQGVEIEKDEESEAELAWGYAMVGKRQEAVHLVNSLEAASGHDTLGRYELACAYAALGDSDHAFHWLGEAIRARAFMVVFMKVDPCLDTLRSDPRFTDLLRRIHLAS